MTPKKVNIELLENKALQYRKDILETLNTAGSGHPGGSLSAVEILISLYEHKMNHQPDNPAWDDRDRLIISKGHITPGVYVTLANQGYFPKEDLKGFRKYQSRLQGHVHTKVPGIEFNTGSLGHGLSVANGIAMGGRLLNKIFNVYCLLGDGELQEGSVWEAAMSAAHFKLGHVCAIVDYNKVQENGPVSEIKGLEPLADKWRSFGWEVKEIDGHDFKSILRALDAFTGKGNKPFVIIANTIKGKGVAFMEGDRNWHGKAPNDEQLAKALEELK